MKEVQILWEDHFQRPDEIRPYEFRGIKQYENNQNGGRIAATIMRCKLDEEFYTGLFFNGGAATWTNGKSIQFRRKKDQEHYYQNRDSRTMGVFA